MIFTFFTSGEAGSISTERLMRKTGFSKIEFKTPVTSNIENWVSYNLDSPDDGAALLAEAFK